MRKKRLIEANQTLRDEVRRLKEGRAFEREVAEMTKVQEALEELDDAPLEDVEETRPPGLYRISQFPPIRKEDLVHQPDIMSVIYDEMFKGNHAATQYPGLFHTNEENEEAMNTEKKTAIDYAHLLGHYAVIQVHDSVSWEGYVVEVFDFAERGIVPHIEISGEDGSSIRVQGTARVYLTVRTRSHQAEREMLEEGLSAMREETSGEVKATKRLPEVTSLSALSFIQHMDDASVDGSRVVRPLHEWMDYYQQAIEVGMSLPQGVTSRSMITCTEARGLLSTPGLFRPFYPGEIDSMLRYWSDNGR